MLLNRRAERKGMLCPLWRHSFVRLLRGQLPCCRAVSGVGVDNSCPLLSYPPRSTRLPVRSWQNYRGSAAWVVAAAPQNWPSNHRDLGVAQRPNRTPPPKMAAPILSAPPKQKRMSQVNPKNSERYERAGVHNFFDQVTSNLDLSAFESTSPTQNPLNSHIMAGSKGKVCLA